MNDVEQSSSAGANRQHGDERQEQVRTPTAAELSERRKKNRQMFNKKRGELLDDLLRSLDILVYAELSAIYYMDCSFLRFLFRAFVQFMFLTPKPPLFPEHPAERPIIGGLLGSNLICVLLHLWLNPPSAGEATRGYLHGGLAMDFIGQKGPTSKGHLLMLDLLVVLLQVTHLAANAVRKGLRETSTPAAAAAPQAAPPAVNRSQQDLDAEERGVRRSDELQDIEMQSLNASGTAASATQTSAADDANESSERDTLLANTVPRTDSHIFDAFNSGQIVLADLDLWKNIKHQAHLVKTAASDPQPSGQTLRAELAGRILRMRMRTDELRQTL